MKAAVFVLAVAGPAAAQQFTCAETIALAKSAGAFVQVVNAMTKECQGKVATDQTCQAYVDAIKENALSENLLAFSAQTAALAIRCPDS
ncbi:MAG: hypothetical protein Q4615_04755 [Paracoccus aminovorans]|nr:hypothetical protein [Paracoccus aminovorans]